MVQWRKNGSRFISQNISGRDFAALLSLLFTFGRVLFLTLFPRLLEISLTVDPMFPGMNSSQENKSKDSCFGQEDWDSIGGPFPVKQLLR